MGGDPPPNFLPLAPLCPPYAFLAVPPHSWALAFPLDCRCAGAPMCPASLLRRDYGSCPRALRCSKSTQTHKWPTPTGGGGAIGHPPTQRPQAKCLDQRLWQPRRPAPPSPSALVLLPSIHPSPRPSPAPVSAPDPPPHRDASAGKGPQRRLDRRLEDVAKAVEGGYYRLQMPLKLALAVRGTVAGHRRPGGGGGWGATCPPPLQCIPAPSTLASCPRFLVSCQGGSRAPVRHGRLLRRLWPQHEGRAGGGGALSAGFKSWSQMRVPAVGQALAVRNRLGGGWGRTEVGSATRRRAGGG